MNVDLTLFVVTVQIVKTFFYVSHGLMMIAIKQTNLLLKYFLHSVKANVHLMHLTMLAKIIIISTVKEINFAEMLRPALHDSGKI